MGINTSELLFSTVEKYDEQIIVFENAITRQAMIGAGNMNNSGGSQRSMTEIEFQNVVNFLSRLRKERDMLTGENRCNANILNIEAGW